jgi:hypothetical protein
METSTESKQPKGRNGQIEGHSVTRKFLSEFPGVCGSSPRRTLQELAFFMLELALRQTRV